MKATLLYAEDDPNLALVTRDHLEMQGFAVTAVDNGQKVLDALANQAYDLIILDVMMPALDGFAVARAIRDKDKEVPILFVTAKSLKEDRLFGLRLGADDYIVKPYAIEELILKINIFLRRSRTDSDRRGPDPDPWISLGRYRFSPDQMRLNLGEETIRLTHKEAEVLRILNQNKGQVVRRETILVPVWGSDSYYNSRSLDVFISKLRKHLAGDPSLEISNIHGIGFRLMERAPQASPGA